MQVRLEVNHKKKKMLLFSRYHLLTKPFTLTN